MCILAGCERPYWPFVDLGCCREFGCPDPHLRRDLAACFWSAEYRLIAVIPQVVLVIPLRVFSTCIDAHILPSVDDHKGSLGHG
jgi:hypothetical protein